MLKKLCTTLLAAFFVFGLITLPAQAKDKNPSSIDTIDQGVADTGETHFEKNNEKLTASTENYTVAVLPYVDVSGLEGRSREMAVNAVKETLKTKYPDKKSKVKVVSSKDVQKAMIKYPLENAEAPKLDELLQIGQAVNADRVIYISNLPVREKETGFMLIAGTQTYSATVTMKLKCVDVDNQKYLYNQNIEGIGSSTSINFWKIGEPSKARAVKAGITECMTNFLTSFD